MASLAFSGTIQVCLRALMLLMGFADVAIDGRQFRQLLEALTSTTRTAASRGWGGLTPNRRGSRLTSPMRTQ